jgi:hypothetical protein
VLGWLRSWCRRYSCDVGGGRGRGRSISFVVTRMRCSAALICRFPPRLRRCRYTFLADLRSRLKPGRRIQLTTDGLPIYPLVVDALWRNNIDYAVMQKEYGPPPESEQRRYSPATCTGVSVRVMAGNPDLDLTSTSYVERQNLSMRMGMRRFTRLTDAFSKKVENHAHAVSLFYLHYNFARPHQTLTRREGRPTTPAMAAEVADHPWSLTQIAELLESN